MKTKIRWISAFLFGTLLLTGLVMNSCKKDDNGGGDGKTDPSTIAADNLIAYFPFNINGNDTISGMTPTTTPFVYYVAGRRGKALQGVDNGYLLYDLPAQSPLRNLTAFSIAMWFYGPPAIDGVAPVPGIFQINGTSDPVWGNLTLTQDRMPDVADSLNMKIVFHKDGIDWANQFVGLSNPALIENHWMHVVFTYDNVTSKFMCYVNGVALAFDAGVTDRWAEDDTHDPRTPLGDLAFVDASKFAIGGWIERINGNRTDDWMGYFTGKMDELRIYDKGLTAAEVSELFAAEVSQLNAE
jgi:hypothetical protein